MKQLSAVCKGLLLMVLGLGTALGQQSRTYKETFKVAPDVSVSLNTTHADIEFETWNRNEVVVEAEITLEGATEEEARAYFENGGMKILGNSSEVEISTRADQAWTYRFAAPDVADFDFVMPDIEIPDIAPILEGIEVPGFYMPELPPMPPVPNFDYEAYSKDGEAYMKRWQSEFKEKFTPEYEERMKEWSERMEARGEELAARMEERQARMEERQAEMEERMARRMEEREARMELRAQEREKAAKARVEAREMGLRARKDADRSRVFFMRGNDGNRKFNIKKTIRVKMPKDARLKLNVRHGEVKLAGNTHNMQATLSYSRLLASTIDGDQTDVSVRYSPVAVKSWNNGKLQADFSDEVLLDQVGRLRLSANASEVTIERLLREVSIHNNLGVLNIGTIASDFSRMEVQVQNGQIRAVLPDSPYGIRVANHASNVSLPGQIVWEGPAKAYGSERKGYHQKRDSGRSVVINASYSDVTLKE
ncbi:hypothetical protein [Robiginitalea sediminis]|uniref:hypothetical protein n=1 Tax=Robiginitalea sediminis TaxID=1982593 RepID=UPI001179B78E|nr:hypothetical protein [Robiginitalea sediminis]